ncbi:MAG: hypothetical protein ABIQ56_05630, partial [Chitinophagaceae bacterium]
MEINIHQGEALRNIIVIMVMMAIASCSATKNIPAGDALYTGATVKIEDNKVGRSEIKILESDLKSITRPKPNSKFFGIPFKLLIYN